MTTKELIRRRTNYVIRNTLRDDKGRTLIGRKLKPNKLLNKLNDRDINLVVEKVCSQVAVDELINVDLNSIILTAAFDIADSKPLPYVVKAQRIPHETER